MQTDILANPPKFLRAPVARSEKDAPKVDREGGQYGMGIIRGISVITRGEALGHGMWIDHEFVQSVADGMNAKPAGIKSRFTHPGLSGDGMGKFLGRVRDARVQDGKVVADLHFATSAHSTPDGDLAEYVMQLAEDDPEAFGTSIVFESDVGAEDRFQSDHEDEDGCFKSPDPENCDNLRHARLSRLFADDVVDEPAANPDGLFHRGDEIAYRADEFLSFVMGLTEQRPSFDIGLDPGRAAGFFQRFLDEHGLTVVHKEDQHMAETSTTNEEAVLVAIETDPAELADAREAGAKAERERFSALSSAYSDAAFVSEQFLAGNTPEQAKSAWDARRLASLEEENAALKAQLSAPKQDGTEPVKFGSPAETESDFVSLAKARASEKNIPIHRAMSELAREKPELHRAYIARMAGN